MAAYLLTNGEPENQEYLYRVEGMTWASGLDEWDTPLGPGQPDTRLLRFPVIRRTPKGARIQDDFSERFIRNEGKKRYAVPSVEQAYEDYIYRTKRSIEIMQARVKEAFGRMAIAESELNELRDTGSLLKATHKWNDNIILRSPATPVEVHDAP